MMINKLRNYYNNNSSQSEKKYIDPKLYIFSYDNFT